MQRFGMRTIFAPEDWQQKLSALLIYSPYSRRTADLYALSLDYLWQSIGFSCRRSAYLAALYRFSLGRDSSMLLRQLSGWIVIYLRDVADVTFTFVPLVVLVMGWKRLPLHYSLFSVAMVLFVLCQPCKFEGLMSVPRYLLVIFPIFLIFALWSKSNRLTWQLVIPFIFFFVINIVQFATYNWVA